MPMTFFAHQAPVLPLKMKWPRVFNGTALVIGSMAPDLLYFLRTRPPFHYGHTIVGQFTFCLPVTLGLIFLVKGVLAKEVTRRLPQGGEFHLRDYRALAKPQSLRWWLMAVPCALIGSFSHIAWDGFTHADGWGTRWMGLARPVGGSIAGHPILVCDLLQQASTIVGTAVALWLLHCVGKQRLVLRWAGEELGSAGPLPSDTFSFWATVVIIAVVGAILSATLGRIPYPPGDLRFWTGLVFRAGFFGFLGLCLASSLAAYRDASGRGISDEGSRC